MPLDPGGSDSNPDGSDDNEGPHCRNCHTGANSCNQCHGDGKAKYATAPLTAGKTPAQPNAYLHTSATAGINGQCIDGGFSFPHRTLGVNMLKDELWGVDFDGTAVAVGEVRDATAMLAAGWTDSYYNTWGDSFTTEDTGTADFMLNWTETGEQIYNQAAENLDSVCIDCHGDSTYWNGDDPANYYSGGWDLLFKGLP